MCVAEAMMGHHFQGRGHHHFHSRALHLETEQPVQMEAEGVIEGSGAEVVERAISGIMARENNLDEKPVGGSTTLPITLGVW